MILRYIISRYIEFREGTSPDVCRGEFHFIYQESTGTDFVTEAKPGIRLSADLYLDFLQAGEEPAKSESLKCGEMESGDSPGGYDIAREG